MKTLYIECGNGISGDMSVGMLLDLGADPDNLKSQLESLRITGYEIEIGRAKKSGLDCCDFIVRLDEGHDRPDTHPHEHRGLPEIEKIINESAVTERAKSLAKEIFHILAEAEAKAHGTEINHVHFHEVGAVDSIVDIVAFAVCFDDLGINEVIIPALCEGHGSVRCQHGVIPVPVPAVVNIAESKGLILKSIDVEAELVTPTGAAIAAAVKTKDQLPEEYRIVRSGAGAGKRDWGLPSLLRGMLIEECDTKQTQTDGNVEQDRICKLETNLDDCTGEMLGHTLECLFDAGAKDAYFTPIFMKKNRPAYELSVMCSLADAERIKEIIFRETTTIGIRELHMDRTILKREIVNVNTSMGKVCVKKCMVGAELRVYPEYESVKALCKSYERSYEDVWNTIRSEVMSECGIPDRKQT